VRVMEYFKLFRMKFKLYELVVCCCQLSPLWMFPHPPISAQSS
jgi:hypothetical protein